jgi:hypothetical protein
LLSVEEGAGSLPRRVLASLILGEVALFPRNLGEAVRRLTEAAQSKERKGQADRLIARTKGIATASWLAQHGTIRLKGMALRAATSREREFAIIQECDRLLSQHSHG